MYIFWSTHLIKNLFTFISLTKKDNSLYIEKFRTKRTNKKRGKTISLYKVSSPLMFPITSTKLYRFTNQFKQLPLTSLFSFSFFLISPCHASISACSLFLCSSALCFSSYISCLLLFSLSWSNILISFRIFITIFTQAIWTLAQYFMSFIVH